LDTNERSAGKPTNWALWAAVAMIAAGTLAVLYVLFAASSKPETATGVSRFATGEMTRLTVLEAPPSLPARTLQDASGAETTLAAYRGQVLVVNFWGTWCPPCLEEMPTLGALQRRFEGRLLVLPVAADDEGKRAEAQQLLARLSDNSLPFLIDITRGVVFDVQAPGLPVTIIYDREGNEVARLAGGADWDSPEAVALLEAVLAGEV
jgi:thiol-disulfide isomerase/thioredoxin